MAATGAYSSPMPGAVPDGESEMYQVFTAEELKRKGITKRQVLGALKKAETLCNWFAKRHIAFGTGDADQAKWDAACAKWDHLKATAAVMT